MTLSCKVTTITRSQCTILCTSLLHIFQALHACLPKAFPQDNSLKNKILCMKKGRQDKKKKGGGRRTGIQITNTTQEKNTLQEFYEPLQVYNLCLKLGHQLFLHLERIHQLQHRIRCGRRAVPGVWVSPGYGGLVYNIQVQRAQEEISCQMERQMKRKNSFFILLEIGSFFSSLL